MPINKYLLDKSRKQRVAAMNDNMMKRYSAPPCRVGTYNVVNKASGQVVARGVPLEFMLEYGKAARLYQMVPV